MTKVMKKRPTQKQIADQLGLSAATVSLALRDNPVVAKATRDLVKQAMRDTGYVPNIAAASLRTGRSNIIGISFHTVAHSSYGDLLVAIERAFDASGTVILINNHEDDVERLDRFISTLATYGADALIVAPPPGTPLSVMERVGMHGMPILYIGSHVAGDGGADHIVMDNRAAGEMAVRHLFDAGFERLHLVGGRVGSPVFEGRVKGFRAAIETAGMTWSDDLWSPCPVKPQDAVDTLHKVLTSDPAPTGIVCLGDTVSRVAGKVVQGLGLEPGKDVGLVGIGSERGMDATIPRLTMVCGDTKATGRLCAETILARLGNPEMAPCHTVVGPTLIPGETSGNSGA